MIMTIIDISVVMVHMLIASTKATKTQLATRKKRSVSWIAMVMTT